MAEIGQATQDSYVAALEDSSRCMLCLLELHPPHYVHFVGEASICCACFHRAWDDAYWTELFQQWDMEEEASDSETLGDTELDGSEEDSFWDGPEDSEDEPEAEVEDEPEAEPEEEPGKEPELVKRRRLE